MEFKHRKGWIDFLRGIAMLLVIWGHIAKTEYVFFLFSSPFKLPLFFALTGYLFNERDGNVKAFGKNLLFRIVIPWIILSLVWLRIGYSLVSGHPKNIGTQIYSVVSGEKFWFMPCCILAECIQFFIRKFVGKEIVRYIMMVVIAISGLIMTYFHVAGFALFDVACTAQMFLMLGCLYKNHEQEIGKRMKPVYNWLLLFIYITLVVVSFFMYPNKIMDVHHNYYYNFFLCLLLICISLLLLFTLAPKIKRFPKWIVFVGQNTLVFYILHYAARTLLSKGLSIMHFSLPNREIGYIIEMIYVCVSMTIVAYVLNKFLPFSVGRHKSKT